jgi:uncharacterized protein YbbK (DUF523 family)
VASLDAPKIRVGVSTCLLGEPVRHDAGHKRDEWIAVELGRHFEIVPVCPEVEVGMGVPREPVALVHEGGEVRMRATTSDRDHTRAMRDYAARRAAALAALPISGYVLKSRSPSCGLQNVVIARAQPGRGLFAHALIEALPDLPVVEEEDLRTPAQREQFVRRVTEYARERRR